VADVLGSYGGGGGTESSGRKLWMAVEVVVVGVVLGGLFIAEERQWGGGVRWWRPASGAERLQWRSAGRGCRGARRCGRRDGMGRVGQAASGASSAVRAHGSGTGGGVRARWSSLHVAGPGASGEARCC
jgi:hypothetical protein